MTLQLQSHAEATATAIWDKFNAPPTEVSTGGAAVLWKLPNGYVIFSVRHVFDTIEIHASKGGLRKVAVLANTLPREIIVATAVAIFGSEVAE